MSEFLKYIENGWVLAPLRIGDKMPRGRGWNRREACLDSQEDVDGLECAGLCHSYSGTCCLDIDSVKHSREWLKGHGVDLDGLLSAADSVQIKSGRKDRTKLLYRLPTQPLRSVKVIETIDGVKTNIIDFRCATSTGLTVQDALPPSIHPKTKKPYYWEYDETFADWAEPPVLPPEILALWLAQVNDPGEQKEEVDQPFDAETLTPLLKVFDPDTDYNNWINVGMALHHATRGSAVGLEVWDEWSQRGEKYNGRKELETHWSSFRGSGITIDFLLMHQVADADEFEANPEDPAEKKEKPSAFQLEHISEWTERPPPKWLVRSVMPQADMAMIFGDPGSGKSFLGLDMAMAVAGSGDWWGKKTENGSVMWIAAEAAGSIRNRALAYAKHHKISLESQNLWIIGDTPNFTKVDDVRQIAKAAREIDPSIIFVDTMTAAGGGTNENSGEDMAVILSAVRALHNITKALVVLIHHSGKDKTKGARGWSGIKAAMQTMIEVVHDEDTGDRTATIHKQRDAEEGIDYTFRLKPVSLPRYEGEEQISCVVEPLDTVEMFKPQLHPAWASMAVLPFMQSGADTMKLTAYEEAIKEHSLAVGIEADMAAEYFSSLLDMLVDASLASVEEDAITLILDDLVAF